MLLSLVSLLLLSAVAHADTDVAELIAQRLSKPNSDDFHLTQFEKNSNYALSEEGVLTLQTNRLQGNLRTEVNGFSITLEYDVKLDDLSPGFLPGLFGGKEECEPSGYGKDCFNVSPRWLLDGVGEVYSAIPVKPQIPSLCTTHDVSVPPKLGHIASICRKTGISLYRGTFQLQTNRWHHFKLSVQLNTIGQPDGILLLDVDQVNVIYTRNLLYRESPDLIISGISFNLTTSNTGPGMQFKNIHIDYEIKEPFNSTFTPYSELPMDGCSEDEYRCEVEGGPFFFQCVDETFVKRNCGKGTMCHQVDSGIECVFPE